MSWHQLNNVYVFRILYEQLQSKVSFIHYTIT